MPDKTFIDSNIVLYAIGQPSSKAQLAAPLFVASPTISTQVISETANVASRRFGPPVSEVRRLLGWLQSMCTVEALNMDTVHLALDVRERYGYSWYDSLIIAAALESNCNILYSEDMQHGQVIREQLKIVNPFADQ